ncbi:hypothetical protein R1sor_000678 [Riccia sorocarpa]|uniref:Aminotransferase-like plant mobile domain-containing protein n=1 Tax=Riccia sorocarpa TaxID=122646 RepID=A0ABD3GVI0_9MARC
MPPSFVGKCLPSIKLMEAELTEQFASADHGFLKKIAQFVPDTFKELREVDLVEFSALGAMNMLKYVSGLQRFCIPEDVFWYALWNTDADGDRLLIKGNGGSTCVVGWHEVSVAFGASHGEAEEFRAIKINNKNFAQYRPGEYLPETVETNAARKLVNGQPYEEISYYKEAASYGPTYFLMTVICELFWCNGRSTRFTTPMVYAYMRSIHGFNTNWAKVILHCLKIEICFLRAHSPENTKVTPVVWAPVFIPILYAFRSTVFAGTQLATPDAWVPWVHMTKEGEIDLKGLYAKFPATIEDIKLIRESCQLSDKIPIAEPVNGAPADGNAALVPSKMPARKRAREVQVIPDDATDAEPQRNVRTRTTSRRKSIVTADPGPSTFDSSPTDEDSSGGCDILDPVIHDFGQKMGPVLADIISKRMQVTLGPRLVDANVVQDLKSKLAALTTKLAESERSRTSLHARVEALKAELIQSSEKAATEAAADSAAKLAKLQQDHTVLQQQLQTEKAAVGKFKAALQTEVQKISNLEQQIVSQKEDIESHKFTAERAERAQSGLRTELAQVKTELRMLQISGN